VAGVFCRRRSWIEGESECEIIPTHPTSEKRIVYAIHDGHDLGRSEPVRILIARAILRAAGVNEDAYWKKR
jgi:hypothetical protein